jgi:hypothetical protein
VQFFAYILHINYLLRYKQIKHYKLLSVLIFGVWIYSSLRCIGQREAKEIVAGQVIWEFSTKVKDLQTQVVSRAEE